jgi:UDP-glucose 4-epimerase
MSVLVTGGAGYIGGHMVLALLDAGEDVVVVDNLSTGFRCTVPEGAHFVKGDVGDRNLITRLLIDHAVETVIHFAGSIIVPDSVRDPLGYYLNNTCKSRTLIASTVEAKVKRFIFSSTAAVYGAPKNNPIAEDTPLQPISPYGRSKLMTEMMLHDVGQAHDLRYVALRYFNVAGADPAGRSGQSTPHASHLIKVAVQAALGQRPYLEVFGTDYPTPDGTCVRDFIHVTDLIELHLASLAYLRQGGHSDVLNCGYGRGFSVLEVIDAVKRSSNKDFPVRLGSRRPGDPAALVADVNRITEVLSLQPRYNNLDILVDHALSWERRLIEETSLMVKEAP